MNGVATGGLFLMRPDGPLRLPVSYVLSARTKGRAVFRGNNLRGSKKKHTSRKPAAPHREFWMDGGSLVDKMCLPVAVYALDVVAQNNNARRRRELWKG